jgi:hypothetical protein
VTSIKRSEDGIDYLIGVLNENSKSVTRAIFWKIAHKTSQKEDISLKLGRYRQDGFAGETVQEDHPRSELTLDNNEFLRLVDFLLDNYEPFRKGVRQYIPVGEEFDQQSTERLRAVFSDPNQKKTLDFIATNKILPDDLIAGLQTRARIRAVSEFEKMLGQNLVEQKWQEWFTRNDWVLGSEFVEILDQRAIDTAHIADFLMRAYDGFLDIIEIKRPEPGMRFWASGQNHGNCVPSTDLTKAITQAMRYIYEVELEANSAKFLKTVGNVKAVKPRCVLIFGRSLEWSDDEKETYRILNSSYHNLTIMTYDHVLERARRISGVHPVQRQPGP